jgi:hypothetical protein
MWIRLKLIAPFHSPRAPRFFSPASPFPPFEAFVLRLGMTALHLDQFGFARYGFAAHLLPQVGPAPLVGRRVE